MSRKHFRPHIWDDPDADPGDEATVTCDRCGKTNLERVNCGTVGWKLYEGERLHVCKTAARAEDFPDEQEARRARTSTQGHKR
jgi:hypothetical protein